MQICDYRIDKFHVFSEDALFTPHLCLELWFYVNNQIIFLFFAIYAFIDTIQVNYEFYIFYYGNMYSILVINFYVFLYYAIRVF